MADETATPMDYDAHNSTFANFVNLATGSTIACIYVCVALVGFGIGDGVMSYLIATFGLLIGLGACVFGAASDNNSWVPAGVLLVLMGLATVAFL